MSNPESQILLTISTELANQRRDKALAALADGLSRARVQALLGDRQITLNGKPVTDASAKVKEGEIYTITLPPPEPAEPEAQDIALDVVYEDKDVIVINKPAGLVVHPAPGNRDKTLVNALLAHCGDSLSGIGGVARPGIVHRLDKDTSGLIIIAKHDEAHQKLAAQFADRSLSRTYQALVWGVPMATGLVDAPIGRSPRDRKKMAVTTKGRHARTHYKLLEDLGKVGLVECTLETGRTHQIRVHMAHIKHPVVGDAVYGKGRTGVDFPRQALHAAALRFIHPRTGKEMKLAASMPKDMKLLLKKCRSLKN